MSYQPKVYREQGGDSLVVASGGTLQLDSGAIWTIGGVTVTATAADLNAAGGAWTNIDAGSASAAGSLDIFAGTGAGRKLIFTCADTGANSRTMTVTNAAIAATRAYTIPDAGGDGMFVMTTAANTLLVNVNSANRTMSLSGNVTVGSTFSTTGTFSSGGNFSTSSTVAITGAFSTAGAVSFTGANDISITTVGAYTYTLPAATCTLCAKTGTPDATFTVDEGNATGTLILKNTTGGTNHSVTLQTTVTAGADVTLTLPGASGTLALATGAETGTTSSTFTVDSDSANARIVLDTNSATGNFTLSLVPANLTANRVVTFQDSATQTVVARDTTDTLTNKTLTAPVINGATTAAAANNFSLHTGSGAFTTPTGGFTHYGNVANNGNVTWTWSSSGAWDMSGSSGTFKTPTGTNTLGGDVVISGTKTFTTGTGAVAVNGSATIATTKTLTFGSAAAGTTTPITMYSLTANKGALILQVTNAATDHATTLTNSALNGAAATITLPAATCTLPGIGLANTFTIVQTVAIDNATNNGVTDLLALTHTTSGDPSAGMGAGISIIVENDTDATTETATIDWVMTNDGTKATMDVDVVFSTMLGGAMQPAVSIDASDQSLTVGQNVTDADGVYQIRIYPVTTAKGSFIIQSVANTTDHTVTLVNGTANGANATITTPAATCTLASLALAETLTNKSIDGDDNTLTDVGPKVAKASVKGTRGATDAVAGMPFVLHFDMDNTAGTSTWINDLDPARSCKVLDAWYVKTDGNGTAGDTVQVGGSGGAITEAKALNAVNDLTRGNFAQIDDSKTTIAHDATITVTTVADGDHCECEVFVLCAWV
jgi:hypothetical protein